MNNVTKQRYKNTVVVKVDKSTLTVTHIFDGEEVVTGGEDGQTWVGVFSNSFTANLFIALVKQSREAIYGERQS